MSSRIQTSTSSSSVADILERVLDMGVVIAGDIRIKLVDIELLTIQIRLVVCSIDKAREIGMDWWNLTVNKQAPNQQEPSQQVPNKGEATGRHEPSRVNAGPSDASELAFRLEAMEKRMKELEKVGIKAR